MRFLLRTLIAPLVLSLLYFVLVSPLALILRIAGRDPMQRKFDRASASYRTTSPQTPKEQLEKTY